MKKIVSIVLGILGVSYMAFAADEMTEVYNVLPNQVDNLNDMFLNGEFYGRLRVNSFMFDWDKVVEGRKEDHYIVGVGGSLIYKSAYFNGFAVTVGLYTTQNPWHMGDDKVIFYKSGKDVLSRYDVLTKGQYGITSMAQSYLEYKNQVLSVKAGRLIYESFLTKSNDTKMIPNTFEGLTLHTDIIPHTKFKAALLTRQKLRDHSSFHHILAFGYDGKNPYSVFTQNDDAAMHRGLTLLALEAKGIDDKLITFEGENKAIDNLTLLFNYTAVPELISSVMVQANYGFNMGKFRVLPAVRYMRQFDNGAGEIGGANAWTKTFGYANPKSLDSSLFAARVDLAQNVWALRFGYSKVADAGDIIAPWRGFPTAEFTRAMGQYNWSANTESYMIRADYNFGKDGKIIDDMKIFVRYVIQDFDDNKPGVQPDRNVLTLDILKEFDSMPGLYMKIRMAYADGKDDTYAGDGSLKPDLSYNEIRFELNYLF